MNKISTQPKEIQMGSIDAETHEVIKLINSYPLPGDFFHWLSNGNVNVSTIDEKIADGKYKKLAQFHVKESLVFTSKRELELENLPKETIQFFTKSKTPHLSTNPELSKFCLERKTKIASDLHYTIISNILYNNLVVGACWEIYELPRIIQLYNKLEDPLRYWRNG